MSQLTVAVVIYESVKTGDARAYRGLKTALELKEAGDDVTVLFDGSGVETLAAISDSDHPMHALAQALKENTIGACAFCANAHKSTDAIVEAGWTLLDDNAGEASIRELLIQGRTVLNF